MAFEKIVEAQRSRILPSTGYKVPLRGPTKRQAISSDAGAPVTTEDQIYYWDLD